MAYVIIGASGDLGRALALEFAGHGARLILVGHGRERLREAADAVEAAGHPRPATVAADVTEGPAYLDEIRAQARERGGIEGLLLPIGRATRDDIRTPVEDAARLIAINLTAVMEAASGLWEDLSAAKSPVIVGFGSITAIRGRDRNLAYGAAKRGLQSYFESLRLLGDGPGIKAQFYMLGFLDTPKLAAEPAALPRGDVSKLARMVHANLGNGSFTRWYPWWWRPLAWVLRMLPEGLYGWVVARRSG